MPSDAVLAGFQEYELAFLRVVNGSTTRTAGNRVSAAAPALMTSRTDEIMLFEED